MFLGRQVRLRFEVFLGSDCLAFVQFHPRLANLRLCVSLSLSVTWLFLVPVFIGL